MTRTLSRFTRLLTTAALILGAGCEGDENHIPGDQKANPVAPVFLFLDVRVDRTSIIAESEKPINVTVQANFADTGQPVPNGTVIHMSTTLGSFDSIGGPSTLELEIFGGLATLQFFPGSTAGTARIRAELQGVVDTATVTIRPFVEPIPPPTASSLSMAANPTTASEEDSETVIAVEATVVGSNAEPFENAPVQFSSPIGVFDSSGTNVSEILTTDADGKVSDNLTVSQAELEAFSGSSFEITGTLFLEGGSQTSTTVTITIIAGPADPVAANVTLSSSASFILDDGSNQTLNLDALVQDQFGAAFGAGQVAFSCPTLGTFTPPLDTSDSPVGHALSTFDATAASVSAHPTNTFTITATLTTPTGTDTSSVVITIVRPPIAEFAFEGSGTCPCNTAVFDDQSTGSPTSWSWDFDTVAGASVDSTLQNPTHDFSGDACFAGGSCSVQLTATNAAGSSSITKVITVPIP